MNISALYLDSSVLVKYYIAERGSAWIASQLDAKAPNDEPLHRTVTIHLSNVEVVCALERAYRSGRIDADELASARRRFLLDMRQRYRVIDADLSVTLLAVELAQRHPLRAYDAIHLAAALDITTQAHNAGLPPLVFVSADVGLLAAARAEGLATENPNDHDNV